MTSQIQTLVEQMTAALKLDRPVAREQLEQLWHSAEDAFGRCTVAHYLADLQEATEDELEWDLRALRASGELSGELYGGLTVESLLPSLHVNLADDYRRLSRVDDALEQLEAARRRLGVLGDDAYSDLIRSAVDSVGAALAAGSVERLPTNPSTSG
jgi:hypothetical protein